MSRMERYSARGFTISFPGSLIKIPVDEMTLTAELGTGISMDNGQRDGWTLGEAGAKGEIKIRTAALKDILAQAALDGSFEEMGAVDINAVATSGGSTFKVDIYGVKFISADLLNLVKSSNDALTHKLAFEVVGDESRRYLRVDGVPIIKEGD